MDTHRSLLIGTDETLGQDFCDAVKEANPFLPIGRVRHWPGSGEVEKILHAQKPSIVFLETEEPEAALEINKLIRKFNRGTQVVAFSRQANEQTLLHLMRGGISEWFGHPFQAEELRVGLSRVHQELVKVPPAWEQSGHIFSFLPAKPGSGASTMALNLAAAIARVSDSRVALLDLDLNCGILAFLLKLGEGRTVRDAAEQSERLDEAVWARMISRSGKLDILRSGTPTPGGRIDVVEVQRLLAYSQRNYAVTCVDLSGNLERYAIEAMERSAIIFQVCTPDLASLHLARRNLEFLESLDLRDRMQVVVNRATFRKGLNAQAVREILDVDEFIAIPNSYSELETALGEARPLGPKSSVGARLEELARVLMGTVNAAAPATQSGARLNLTRLKSAVSAFQLRKGTPRLPPQVQNSILQLALRNRA